MFAILAFGDSIVQGRKGPANRGWAQMLKENFEPLGEWNFLFNLGIPGETTHTLLRRFRPEMDARLHHRRDGDKVVVLFGIGTNDAKCTGKPDVHETSPQHFRDNLHALIEQARAYTGKIAFVGLLPVDEKLVDPYEDTWFTNERQQQYNTIIREVCDWEHVLFIDLFEGWMSNDYAHLLADGVHPTEAGHGLIYEKVRATIKHLWEGL